MLQYNFFIYDIYDILIYYLILFGLNKLFLIIFFIVSIDKLDSISSKRRIAYTMSI